MILGVFEKLGLFLGLGVIISICVQFYCLFTYFYRKIKIYILEACGDHFNLKTLRVMSASRIIGFLGDFDF